MARILEKARNPPDPPGPPKCPKPPQNPKSGEKSPVQKRVKKGSIWNSSFGIVLCTVDHLIAKIVESRARIILKSWNSSMHGGPPVEVKKGTQARIRNVHFRFSPPQVREQVPQRSKIKLSCEQTQNPPKPPFLPLFPGIVRRPTSTF